MRYAAARRGRRDRALELPAGDPLRDDRRGAGGRQRGRAEAGRAVARRAPARSSRRSTSGGVPRDALALLPGYGDAGAALVRDPRVHVIAFTGSSAVGLEILRGAAETPEEPGPREARRVGDGRQELRDRGRRRRPRRGRSRRSCTPPSATPARSARRPPACWCTRRWRTRSWSGSPGRARCCAWGRPTSSPPRCPPVIEAEAQERVLRYAGIAEREGRIAGRAAAVPETGWFCPPALAVGLAEDSPVNREEIFGPLLSVTAVEDMEEACDVVDGAAVRPHRRPVLAQPRDRRARRGAAAGRQPVREPRYHRGDGGPPAVRRQPPLGNRGEGGRAGLPVAVHRAARGHGEHDAAGNTRRVDGASLYPCARERAGIRPAVALAAFRRRAVPRPGGGERRRGGREAARAVRSRHGRRRRRGAGVGRAARRAGGPRHRDLGGRRALRGPARARLRDRPPQRPAGRAAARRASGPRAPCRRDGRLSCASSASRSTPRRSRRARPPASRSAGRTWPPRCWRTPPTRSGSPRRGTPTSRRSSPPT